MVTVSESRIVFFFICILYSMKETGELTARLKFSGAKKIAARKIFNAGMCREKSNRREKDRLFWENKKGKSAICAHFFGKNRGFYNVW